jgi:hypothetical protein
MSILPGAPDGGGDGAASAAGALRGPDRRENAEGAERPDDAGEIVEDAGRREHVGRSLRHLPQGHLNTRR